MKTNKRFTVILSAEQASETPTANLLASESLALYLKYILELNSDDKAESAIGYYKGEQETSYVIHTNSLPTVEHLVFYAHKYLKQECALVSNNADADINLFFADNSPAFPLGRYFVPTKGDGENYTVLNGQNWSVA